MSVRGCVRRGFSESQGVLSGIHMSGIKVTDWLSGEHRRDELIIVRYNDGRICLLSNVQDSVYNSVECNRVLV